MTAVVILNSITVKLSRSSKNNDVNEIYGVMRGGRKEQRREERKEEEWKEERREERKGLWTHGRQK